MLVNIHQITEDGLDFDLERPDLVLEEAGESIPLQQVRASLHLEWEERKLHITGEVSARMGIHCSRCFKAFSLPVKESFDFLGLPSLGLKFPEKMEVSPEELEVTFLQGDEIDLDEIIRENLYLSLPMQPLCSETCKGLCPCCGRDLNEGTCACSRVQVESRFQPLEVLRQKMTSKEE